MATRGPITRQAFRLRKAGTNRGKAWRPIIDRLGYDPRTFQDGKMSLRVAPNGRLRHGLHPFTPFAAPTTPPAGTYDPALDAQLGGAQRGLSDLVLDTDRDRARLSTDFATANDQIHRNFATLASQQADQQASQGIRGGGVLAAAMKRAENEKLEKAPVALAFQRQGEDLTTGLERATREFGQFGIDIGKERFYQATQGGYEPPVAPKGERTKSGVTYRVTGEGPNRKYTLPSGRQMGRSQWVNWWRQRRARANRPVGFGAGV